MTNPNEKWQFNGRYKDIMASLADDAIVLLGCEDKHAIRLANAFAADYGNWKRETEGLEIRGASVTKNDEIKLTEIEKMTSKGSATPAIRIFNALYHFNKVRKHGFAYADCSLKLVQSLNDWLFQVEIVVAKAA